jgi:hypothetical protein
VIALRTECAAAPKAFDSGAAPKRAPIASLIRYATQTRELEMQLQGFAFA